MQDVDRLIRDFAAYLTAASPVVDHMARTHLGNATPAGRYLPGARDFESAWLQASWEMLVEAAVGGHVVLGFYGEGAEIYRDNSERVYRPDAGDTPTHSVVCRPARDEEDRLLDVLTDELVPMPREGFVLDHLARWGIPHSPVFDHVWCADPRGDGTRQLLFRIDDVRFWMRPLVEGDI